MHMSVLAIMAVSHAVGGNVGRRELLQPNGHGAVCKLGALDLSSHGVHAACTWH